MKRTETIKALSFCLAILCMFFAMKFPVMAQSFFGKCGENVSWTLNTNTGVLSITGQGEMEDYASSSEAPWGPYAYEIEHITVGTGVIRIGSHAFGDNGGLSSVTLSNSVQTIGAYAFANCNNLRDIQLGNGLAYLEDGVFYNCSSLEMLEFQS